MRVSHLLTFFPLASVTTAVSVAAVNGRCTGSAATGTWGSSGICIKTSTCTSFGGKYKNNACPNDPDNIKCCLVGLSPSTVNPCGGTSYCDWTSAPSCSGRWISGECPGGDNYKCCRL